MFSTKYIDEVFYEELQILKSFEVKTHLVKKIFHQHLTKQKKKDWSWQAYFQIFGQNIVVATSAGAVTKNQYYWPDFVTKLKSFYFPAIATWTKAENSVTEKIKWTLKWTKNKIKKKRYSL